MTDVGAAAVELLRQLVGIDSVNPALVPGAAGEGAIVDHLRTRLTSAGFDTHVVQAADTECRPSLLAIPREQIDGAPTVVLNGHLDTVGVAGMADPFTPRIEDERLYGRGAADMKGGVAGIVAVAEHLVATGSRVRPVLALVADEEDASLGSEALTAELPALLAARGLRVDVCLIAEPTDLALARTLRGFAVVRVTFTGRAAHSSQADLGVNAVTHLGRLLRAIDERAPDIRAQGGDLMATVVSGGSSAFVIPDRAECLVELRYAPGADTGSDPLVVVQGMFEPDWHAEAELVAHRPAWRLDGVGPAAQLAARLGEELDTGATFDAPYWMEAPLWQDIAPTLICGPSGGGLHAVDEWVDLDQVRTFTRGLARVLSDWGTDAD